MAIRTLICSACRRPFSVETVFGKGIPKTCSAECRTAEINRRAAIGRAKNRERINKRAALYRANNREQINERQNADYRENTPIPIWKTSVRNCICCEAEFTPKNAHNLTCSEKCQRKHACSSMKAYNEANPEERKIRDKMNWQRIAANPDLREADRKKKRIRAAKPEIRKARNKRIQRRKLENTLIETFEMLNNRKPTEAELHVMLTAT